MVKMDPSGLIHAASAALISGHNSTKAQLGLGLNQPSQNEPQQALTASMVAFWDQNDTRTAKIDGQEPNSEWTYYIVWYLEAK